MQRLLVHALEVSAINPPIEIFSKAFFLGARTLQGFFIIPREE
jgi:hypothetical protein